MWSAVAKAAPPPTVAESDTHIPEGRTRIAVVDANAIISGLRLQGFADKYYTIAEVLNEIRDKQARAFLSTLPYGIEVREPSEESVKAVLRFARATGDLQTLSSADIKLVALAHSLELAAHGAIHIRDEPTRPRLRAKHRTRGKGLPGWGSVPNPEDWRVIDEMEDEGTGAGAGKSRIVGGVQSLIQDGSEEQISYPSASNSTAATAPTTTATASQPAAAAAVQQQPLAQAAQEAAASEPATEAQAPAVVAVPAAVVFDAPPGSDDDSDDEDGADDEWQTVGKSKMAARRAKRKAERIAVWEIRRLTQLQQQREAEAQLAAPANIPVASAAAAAPATKAAPRGWGSAAPAAAAVTTLVDAVRELCVGESSANDKAGSSAGAEPDSASGASSAPGSGQASQQTQQQQQQGEEGGAGESEQEGDDGESEGDDEGEEGEYSEGSSGLEEGEEYDEEDGEGSDEDGDGGSSVAPSTAAGTSVATQQEEPLPNTDSSIISVTADFAMQNVLLQMGLRLVTPDGRQISRLTRWALRCSACFFVTKEAGRLFCPRCGNMTMDRVELTVGPDGAECFGVKKKHILRGTKYSLPKPRGGRSTAEPILREDVMMLKMKKKMKKKAVGADGEAIDPFAPEFTSDAWFKGQQIANNKGAAAVLAGWKHNPNERKNISRSSRRK